MRLLLQRVAQAAVDVDGQRISEIGRGLLVFVGVGPDDDASRVSWLAEKTLGLRIFPDADKPMNRSVVDVGGELLVVSQFTLMADTSRGKRPGFSSAAPPELAESLYSAYVHELSQSAPVQTGRFGANMQISLINDGPVTFVLEK